jgi:hypothetical protein
MGKKTAPFRVPLEEKRILERDDELAPLSAMPLPPVLISF